MILYFSATGNSRYIAENIAAVLKDEVLDLNDRIRRKDYSVLRSKKPFVICCPIYICDMPMFLTEHLKHQRFAGNRKVYMVFTSGAGFEGAAGAKAKMIFEKKRMRYMGHANVKMPKNYVASNLIKPDEDGEVHFLIANARPEAEKIANFVRYGKQFKMRHVWLIERAVIESFVPVWAKYMQPSAPFHTTDKCIGCGKCSKVCPLNNIEMKDRKPVWKSPCAHCMACICNCPAEAIEFGNITQDRVKYHIRKYLRSSL